MYRTFPLRPGRLGDFLASHADRPAALRRAAHLLSRRARLLRDAADDTLGLGYADAMSDAAQAAYCAAAATSLSGPVALEAEDAAEAFLEDAADRLAHLRSVVEEIEAWRAANLRAMRDR